MNLCEQPVRGGGTCKLEPFHPGYHSTIAYECDGCGRRRRGYPHATSRDGEYPDGLQFCFLCSAPQVLERKARILEDIEHARALAQDDRDRAAREEYLIVRECNRPF